MSPLQALRANKFLQRSFRFQCFGFRSEGLCAENHQRRIRSREASTLAGEMQFETGIDIERDARIRATVATPEEIEPP